MEALPPRALDFYVVDFHILFERLCCKCVGCVERKYPVDSTYIVHGFGQATMIH